MSFVFFFFQAEDGIRDGHVTGVQTCALPILDTTGFRPMGSAEGTMSVFAKRLKNGRSWSDEGLDKFFDVMVAFKDNLEIKTLQGVLEQTQELTQENKEAKPPKHFVEKLKDSAAEATRNNLGYLKQAIGKPITDALKGLRGI